MSATRPIIVGSAEDEHVKAVTEALGCLGSSPVLVDCPTLESQSYSVGTEQVVIGDTEISLSEGTGWIRRLTPPNWRPDAKAGSREAAVRSSFVRLLISLIRLNKNRSWISTLEAQLAADDKIAMAKNVRSKGVPVPTTVSVSDSGSIPESFGSNLLVKPHGPGHFVGEDFRDFVVHAKKSTRDEIEHWPLQGAPFLVQRFLEADEHFRVVTVGSKTWVASLPAEGLPADWRESAEAHGSFRLVHHSEIASRASLVAGTLQLGFSSQDWIKEGSEFWLVDVNPAGQWLFLPDPIPIEVATELAKTLAGEAQ